MNCFTHCWLCLGCSTSLYTACGFAGSNRLLFNLVSFVLNNKKYTYIHIIDDCLNFDESTGARLVLVADV